MLNNPYKYVDPSGHYVVVQGGKVEAALRVLRSTQAGEALYAQLRDSKNVFRLKDASEGAWGGSFSISDDDYAAQYGGTGGTTQIDFSKEYFFKDETGKDRVITYAEVLAHEMGHLADYDTGSLSSRKDWRERKAIRKQNEVRKELGTPGQVKEYEDVQTRGKTEQ